MITMLTSNSIRVNPESSLDFAQVRKSVNLVDRPVPDCGVDAFATFLTVASQRENIYLAVNAGTQVQVWPTPGLLRHAIEVATGFQVAHTRIIWVRYE